MPDGDFSDGEARARYAVDYLVPFWQKQLETPSAGILKRADSLVRRAKLFTAIDTGIRLGVKTVRWPSKITADNFVRALKQVSLIDDKFASKIILVQN